MFDCQFLDVDSWKNSSESLLTGILKRANLLEINFLYKPGSMLLFSYDFELAPDLTSS